VESFDLNAFGISQTEETRTMENPTFMVLGNPRNGISSIFDWRGFMCNAQPRRG